MLLPVVISSEQAGVWLFNLWIPRPARWWALGFTYATVTAVGGSLGYYSIRAGPAASPLAAPKTEGKALSLAHFPPSHGGGPRNRALGAGDCRTKFH